MNIDSIKTNQSNLDLQKKLNDVSPSFCPAKWLRSTIYLHLGTTHSCCIPKPHKIPIDEIQYDVKALHATAHKLHSQKLMLSGERPDECGYCWKAEDNNQLSDRVLKSHFLTDDDSIHKIVNSQIGDEKINPAYLEIAFDSVCNFKCLYCSPQYSSTWAKELEALGPYPIKDYKDKLEVSISKPIRSNNPYLKAFWKWWPSLVDDLKVFRVTGGEPLLSPEVWKLLKWFEKNPKPHLILALNSNMGVSGDRVHEFVQQLNMIKGHIKSFTLFTSMESVGEQAEYSRYGLNFSLFDENIKRVIQGVDLDIRLSFMSTLNVFSLPKLPDWLKYIQQLRCEKPSLDNSVDFTHLQYPEALSLKILPKEFVSYFDQALELIEQPLSRFSTLEISKLKKIRSEFLTAEVNERTEILRARFRLIVKEVDLRRKTDFSKTFPEYSSFI